MATRSHIGMKNTDGTVDYIYCHYDGYPNHNGNILVNHYQTVDKVNQLLELGDLNKLGKEIDECVAYGRDRGESNVNKQKTQFDTLLKDDGVNYLYVFDGDYWECYDTFSKESFKLIYTNQVV